MTFPIPELSIRAWYLAMRPLSQRSIGGTYASTSSLRVDVALNAPRTTRKPLFCSACSLAARPFGFLLALVGWCYASALYAIAGRTTAWYTCRALSIVAPHVERQTVYIQLLIAKYKVRAPPCIRALLYIFPLSHFTQTAQGQLVRTTVESLGHYDLISYL